MNTTTLIQVLRSNGLQAWEDCEGDIEVSSTFINEQGLERKQVVSIAPTLEAVKTFLVKDRIL